MSTAFWDELFEHPDEEGNVTALVAGKLIQSPEPPPDFVDPAWLSVPDILWRWNFAATIPSLRARRWTFSDPASHGPMLPEAWLSQLAQHRPHPERLRVAHVLAEHADHHTGRNVRPAVSTVARQLGRSRERVNGHVKRLHDDGWLARTGKARRGVIVYSLTLPSDQKASHNQ